jgi:hypothetical protein
VSIGKIPSAKADLRVQRAAYEALIIKKCGHGKTWDQECSDCNSVWREDRIRDLVKQAAKYGFSLTPLT